MSFITHLEELKVELETIDLHMAPQKLVALPGRGEIVSDEDMIRLQQDGIPLAGEAEDNAARGAKVVGMFVGNRDYQLEHIRKLMAPDGDIRQVANKLIKLDSPHARLQLMVYGLVTKLSYAARNADPAVAREVFAEFDQLVAYLAEIGRAHV